VAFEKLREANMSESNEWGAFAADWLANKDAAKKFENAAKDIKALVKPDVGLAFGHGVHVKRAKNNSLTISAEK
jgi:hypothetical protein